MTNLTKRLIAALALALGVSLTAAPAFAAIPDGPGGLTTCVDLDENGFPQCPHPGGDEDLPEAQPDPEDEPEVDDSSDPAPVDDAIVATPNFTG
jgi:hypothetical protein